MSQKDDLISRQAAIDAVVGCTNCGTEDVLRTYVTKHYLDNGYCSECDFELHINDTPYCPNCGADMRAPVETAKDIVHEAIDNSVWSDTVDTAKMHKVVDNKYAEMTEGE